MTLKLLGGLVVMLATSVVNTAGAAPLPADLIISGGPIYTLEDSLPQVEAVAVIGNRIVYTGSTVGADKLKGSGTRFIDLQGGCMLPGLVDAHGHLLSLGRSLTQLNLTGTTSPEQIRDSVLARQKQQPPGAWIRGRGWDQNDWARTEFPTWRDLAGTEANPIILRRVDGHAAWVNKTALEACGITARTADPPGGRILRDSAGDPTGVLVDNAADLVSRFLPQPTREELAGQLEAAIKECHRFGLTGVHDAGVDSMTLDLYRQFRSEDRLTLRVYAMLSDEDSTFLDRQLAKGPDTTDQFLIVRAVKLYADGALGSRGAALLEAYSDEPGNTGLLVNQPEYLERITDKCMKFGFQVCTHAIGDRGVRVALEAYSQALAQRPPGDYRLRVEHAQVIAPPDIRRFAKWGIIASMQPTHATSDMPWAQKRLGPERIRGAYAWRTLLDSGAHLALGSDFPIESPNPLLGIYAAITRQDFAGLPLGGWQPQEKINLREAVRGFTCEAAWAAFSESLQGSIRVGKLADFTILGENIFALAPEKIPDLKVKYTLVDGRVVYALHE